MLLAGVAVMVRDKYAVRLALEQREELQRLIRVGKHPARVTVRARILLKSDDGWPAPQVAEALDVVLATVYRVKQRFTEEGLTGVLKDRPQANRRRKLDDRGEAHLIALAYSPPPAGHDHWTLRPLAGKLDFTQNPGKVMDDITFVRSHWWLVSEGFSLSTANSDVQKLPATLYHRIADSLAYAA